MQQQSFKMRPQRTGLSLQSPLRPLSVLVFHLLLTHSCRGQSQLIGPLQPIVALVGDDIILPCHLEPAEDVAAMTLEWTRPDPNSIVVFAWRAGKDLVHVKDPSYRGRTSLFTDGLKRGNISLKLSKVKPSDEGRYQCYIPKLNKESLVELVVASGSASYPVISLAGIDKSTSGVLLECKSKGWYPEPEVSWLDGEGNLLSAGPPETVRGPDDLYTVSSRVTVEKRHSNSFTCRVQQKNTNQTREAHIQVPDDFFKLQSSSVPVITGLAVSLAVCIVFILLLLFVVLKWRLNRIKTQRNHFSETNKSEDKRVTEEGEREREQLMTRGMMEMELKKKRSEQQLQEEKRREEEERREQKRREEQQKEVETLKEELQIKKIEIETKGAELHEVKKRNEDELQSLKEELQKKNKELERTINTRSGSSSYHWMNNQQATNMQWKKSNEDLNKAKHQLKIKNEEINQLKREFDKKLHDQQESYDRYLKQLMTNWTQKFYDEMDRREEAEKEVEKLKKEMETKVNAIRCNVLEVDDSQSQRDSSQSQRQGDSSQSQWKGYSSQSQWKGYSSQSQRQGDSYQSQRQGDSYLSQRQGDSYLSQRQGDSSQSQRQWDSSLSQRQGDSSLSQRQGDSSSATEPGIVIEVDQQGQYVRLRNTSHQDQQLGEWELQGQINNTKPITYTFHRSFTLRSGNTVKIWVPNYGPHYPPSDLVWKDLKRWSNRDKLKFTLISNTGKIQLQLSL